MSAVALQPLLCHIQALLVQPRPLVRPPIDDVDYTDSQRVVLQMVFDAAHAVGHNGTAYLVHLVQYHRSTSLDKLGQNKQWPTLFFRSSLHYLFSMFFGNVITNGSLPPDGSANILP
ncbi:hypothetical protein BX616_002045, partial [Lobosporangium transversale]